MIMRIKENDMKSSTHNRKGSLRGFFIAVAVVPALFLGIFIMSFSSERFKKSIYSRVESELKNLAYAVANTYDRMYPGDYAVVSSDKYNAMKKGDAYLADSMDFIESISEDTESEITFFYGDIRYVTTLKYDDGTYAIGSKVNSAIKEAVIDNGESHFYTNVRVGSQKYAVYYLPLHNADGSTVAMLAVLRNLKEVDGLVRNSVNPILVISMIVTVIAAGLTILCTHKTITDFRKLDEFLGYIEAGELDREIDDDVKKRNDELGVMSRTADKMKKSLIQLVERDALTSLFNRRYGNKKLLGSFAESDRSGMKFAVAIGDIDYFKKVNDTYGHEAGDEVLKEVARTLRTSVRGKGYAARWGGEEFLVVFEDMEFDEAKKCMKQLMDNIHNIRVKYNNITIKINMSFGLTCGTCGDGTDEGEDIDARAEKVIRCADRLLYEAKENGRNRIVAR